MQSEVAAANISNITCSWFQSFHWMGCRILDVEAIRRSIEGYSFDEPSQHLGRLHMAAQQDR